MPKFSNNINLQKNELQNAAIQKLSTAPATPVLGQIYFDTNGGANQLYICTNATGPVWTPVQQGVVSDATTSAKGIVQLAGDLTGTAASPTIANLAVTGAKIAANTITAAKIAANTITASEIAANTITSSQIAALTITGAQIAATTIAIGKIDTTSVRLDNVGAPTASVALNSQKITGLLDPTLAQDAATKNYVDTNGSATSDWKQSVRVVASTNGTLATAFANGSVVDGVTLVTGDRILLQGQTTVAERGIYTVNATGAPTRATDADTSAKLTLGARVYSESGTVWGKSTFTYESGAYTAQFWNADITTGSWLRFDAGATTGIAGTTTYILSQVGSTNASTLTTTGLGLGVRTAPAAALDLPSATTAAGGIAFGANEFQVYRSAANELTVGSTNFRIGTVLAGTWQGTAINATYIDAAIARLASPTFTGVPLGPTAAVDTNNTQLATTAFVVGQAAAATPLIDGTAVVGTSLRYARGDHVHPTDTTRSPLAGSASLTTLGTISSGVWNGTALTSAYVPNLSAIAAPTGSVSLNSQKIINLLDPTAAQDAATKNYVDNAVTGLDAKASVRAVATAQTALTGTQTVDGVALVAGDRVLLTGQTAPAENGIWVVAAGAWARATDADSWTELISAYTWVENGTTNADTGWIVTVDPGGTLGSTAVAITQFSASTTIAAGNGLLKTGNSLSVVGTTNRVSVSGAGVDISASYVGQTSITTLGTITAGTWTGTTIAVANGGTGATGAATARTNLAAAGYYSAVGSGTATTYTITQATHGLRASRFLMPQVQDVTTGEVLYTDTTVNASGDVTWTFAASQTLSGFQFTIVG